MSQGERDQLFEKALRRQLRRGELAGEAHADTCPDCPDCPDAELLAAYHERSLGVAEMTRLKEHLVGCVRCQEILASVEETEAVATVTNAPPRSPAMVSEMQPRRRMSIQWVAPAGAIAAGLFVWIAMRENRKPELTLAPARVAVAKQESAPPADSDAATRQQGDDQARFLREQLPLKTAPESRLHVPQSAPATSLGRGALGGGTAEGTAGGTAGGAAAGTAGRAGTRGPSNFAFQQNTQQQNAMPPYSAGKVAGEPSEQDIAAEKTARRAVSGAIAASAPAPLPQPPAAQAPAPVEERETILGGKDIRSDNLDKEKKQVLNGRTAGNRDATAGSFEDSVSMSMASVTLRAPAEVVAPDGKSIWKIAADGKVSHSSDGGKTWKPQNTGVNAALLAGSAPSEQVCWLAGTFGTVLLTTDGGKHWSKLTGPVSVPIAEIHAKDAENAVITLEASRVQFATYNGGQSWTMLRKSDQQP